MPWLGLITPARLTRTLPSSTSACIVRDFSTRENHSHRSSSRTCPTASGFFGLGYHRRLSPVPASPSRPSAIARRQRASPGHGHLSAPGQPNAHRAWTGLLLRPAAEAGAPGGADAGPGRAWRGAPRPGAGPLVVGERGARRAAHAGGPDDAAARFHPISRGVLRRAQPWVLEPLEQPCPCCQLPVPMAALRPPPVRQRGPQRRRLQAQWHPPRQRLRRVEGWLVRCVRGRGGNPALAGRCPTRPPSSRGWTSSRASRGNRRRLWHPWGPRRACRGAAATPPAVGSGPQAAPACRS